MAVNRISLAEQLKRISDVAPVDLDPEDAHLINPDDQLNVNSAARDHYIDSGPSSLRKVHESVSDPKYAMERISRKKLMEIDRNESSDDDRSRDHGIVSDDHEIHPAGSSSDEEGLEQSKSRSPPPENVSTEDIEPDLTSKIRKTREEDQRKGLVVSRQIALWDTLLDARIRLQKAFSASNRLPTAVDFPAFAPQPQVRDALDKMLSEALLLSDELFLLQEHLIEKNDDIQLPARKRRRTDTKTDCAISVSEATRSLGRLESLYHPHLIRTLLKWSSKVQSVSPSVLLPSNRNAFSRSTRQDVKNVVQLIDEVVTAQNEWDKLIERTRVWRARGYRIGSGDIQEHDGEVFDDIDFYQQLLRDVIDSRNGEQVGQDWMAAQKEKKRKKTVDNKASKGRKLRYEVHEKLQNFMVPVPVSEGWHEEQIDELFASLLGNSVEASVDTTKSQAVVEGTQPGSFRVFG